MNFLTLYYTLKPFIPRKLQIAIRRILIRSQLSKYKAVWPIDYDAGNPPDGWSGWPEQKKFALVLTHDVETMHGHEKCSLLMELEQKLGFRSSFNFVPEKYDVDSRLRHQLTANGFEVGVHGLKHDGKLYSNRNLFEERAQRINDYLKEWEAVGFSSPSMHRNLEWTHALNIHYDISTFDTDPFEPQPEGLKTIFPCWIPGNFDSKGYVELPYTLPQDFTLFLIMQEKNITLWKRKLDWIAEKGGMALLNTHPDYLNFKKSNLNTTEYPVAYYEELLQYIKEKYESRYWHILPKAIGSFWTDLQITQPVIGEGEQTIDNGRWSTGFNRRLMVAVPQTTDASLKNLSNQDQIIDSRMEQHTPKILMLLESDFLNDSRPLNEAKLLTKNNYKVSVISLRSGKERFWERIDGISVYRIPQLTLFNKGLEKDNNKLLKRLALIKKVFGYMTEYFYFTTACLLLSLIVLIREGFDVIHAHNPPDTLFVVGAFYKLFGKKFVFDHHDLSPELYFSRLGARDGFVFRTIALMEKMTCKTANIIITTNESYKKIDMERNNVKDKDIFIVRNGPDLKIRHKPTEPKFNGLNSKKLIGYAGVMNPQDGLDYLLRAIKHLVYDLERDDFYAILIGSGDVLPDLKNLTFNLRISNYVKFTGFIPYEDMISYLSTTDICVEPSPFNPLNEVSTFIKIMDYMALKKPIVCFDLKETRISAQDAAIYVTPNSEMAFAKAILKLMDDARLRDEMGKIGRQRVEEKLSWEHTSINLLRAYENLFNNT